MAAFTKQVIEYLSVPAKGNYKWCGSFDILQSVINELLDTTTKWTTPGGGSKLYEGEDISVRWYSTNFSLCIKGTKGDVLKEKLLQMKLADNQSEQSRAREDSNNTSEILPDKSTGEASEILIGLNHVNVDDFDKIHRKIDNVENSLKGYGNKKYS